jgi:hypothetical protein
MEMQQDRLKEVLSQLFTVLEAQETNCAAVLQLLKDEGIASDEKLATYLNQAGNASNVKWRAARMRMEYPLTPIQKQTSDNDKAKAKSPEAKSPEAKSSEAKSDNRNAENTPTTNSIATNGTPNNENNAASVKSA